MQLALFICVALILLMLVSGAYIFCVACCRGKTVNWHDDEAVQKTPFAKYIPQIAAADQWLKDHRGEDVYITAKDGVRLHGVWVSAEHPKGTVILFHGYRSTFLIDFSVALEFYCSAGYNLLLPDQRAHGKSEGKFITFGVKESDDVLCWVNFHNNKFSALPVIISGLSMGASTVLYVADQDLPQNVKGIIADCGFTSPKEIIGQVYEKTIHLPSCLAMWSVNLFTKLFAGFSIADKDTRRSLANSRIPVLMVHGREDDFVPCSMSEAGYEACTGKKKLLIVEGADHGVSFIHDREGYTQAVMQFLNENVDS